MRTTRIYLDTPLKLNTTVELERQAAHHLTRVLRLRQNDQFVIFNGLDGEFTAELIIDNKKTFARIIHHSDISTQSSINITLLQCISKGDRMDFAIQKATELGVEKIIPVISEYTSVNLKADRLAKKLLHWQAVAISACEQSGRNEIPEIKQAVTFQDQMTSKMSGTKLVFDPVSTTSLASVTPQGTNYFLLIGPEGGLSESELVNARDNGFTGIKMGHRILRTETAALAGITAIQTLWGDFKF